MIIRLKCVMMDGTAPITGDALVPYVQHLDGDSIDLPSIPAGVDIDFQLTFVGQDDEPFDMTGYAGVVTARRSSTSADPIFANAITFDDDTGTSFATHNDTKDESPRTAVYDVQVESADSKVSQPLPQSHFKITAAIGDIDDEIAALTTGLKLVGLPPGVTIEDTEEFGSPMFRGTDPNGFMSFTSDGVGASWGGTGITAKQEAVSANSAVNLTVNDVSQLTARPGRIEVNLIHGSAAPTLAIASNAVAPTVATSFIGDGLLKTITPTYSGSGWYYLIPTGSGLTWDATGNIAVAGTAVQGRMIAFWRDAGTSLFYPSYV